LSAKAPSEAELIETAQGSRQEVAIGQTRVELTTLALRMGESMNRPAASQGYSSLERGMMPDASAGMPMEPFGGQRKFRDDETPDFARTEAYLAEIRINRRAAESARCRRGPTRARWSAAGWPTWTPPAGCWR
jgi:hypothetical protein